MASFCQFCGAQLMGDARFCTSCGRTVADGSATAAPPPPPAASPPPPPPGPAASQPSQPWAAGPTAAPWAPGAAVARGGSRLPLVVGAVVVVVVAAIVLSLAATSGPADAVTGHLAALAKGDDAAAYAFTATGFRSETSLAQFTAFLNANPIFRSATSAITSRTVSGDTGTVEVDLTPPTGTMRSAEFLLVKEGSDWKIVGYKLRAATGAPTTAPQPTPAAPAAPAASQAAAPAGARTNVPAAAAPAGATTKVCAVDATPAASGVELIKNGTFDAGKSGWIEAKYFAPNPDTAQEIAATTGVVTFSTVVRGSTRAGLVQALNVDVTGATKVELTAVLQVDGATLGGTGQQGREAAIAFGVVYYDDACVLHNALPETPTATVNRMFWGGLYLKDPGAGETAAFGEKVAAGQWTRVSMDLTQLRAKVIVLVGVEGSGWGPRSGSADMISLKVTR